MKLKRLMILISIVLILFLSIGISTAGENATAMSDSIDMQDNLMDGNDDYNAEMRIHHVDFKDEYADTYVNVYNDHQELVTDAKVYMNGNHTADVINDENKEYQFHIPVDGTYTLTLDDGFYRASPLTLNFGSSSDVAKDTTDDMPIKIKLVSKNVTRHYNDLTDEIIVHALDENGEHISGLNVLMNDADGPDFDDEDGYQFFMNYLPVGTHKFKISMDEEGYVADPIYVNVKVLKSTPKLTAKKWVSTTKQYSYLKVYVKDLNGDPVDEGTVKFTINGKSYNVKVRDGVAVKKIKLTKAKNYKYKATFTGKNYVSKSVTSKVFVKKAKKYYTLKIRNPKIKKTFTVKLSYKKYIKALKAKNNNKLCVADVFTGMKRPEEYGGGYYSVGLSINDDYHTHYGYSLGDYIYLYGAGSYLCLKKVNLYTTNF